MKFATTTALLASTATAIKMKAQHQKPSSLTKNLMKVKQDDATMADEDDEWLSYGFDSEKFTGTPEEICQLESEYWAAIF